MQIEIDNDFFPFIYYFEKGITLTLLLLGTCIGKEREVYVYTISQHNFYLHTKRDLI